MYGITKTVNELHAMLKLHEETLPKKDVNPALHAIRAGRCLRGSKKLKPGALSLYVGDGNRAAVEAIGSYHLELPSGLVIILNNYHYTPSITKGVILVSRLYDDGFINRFDENNFLSVSKNNLVYFVTVLRDGIFEVDMSCSNINDSSMYNVSNKRAKINLDSSYLWHCRLGHISKKRIEKLQHEGLLNSTDISTRTRRPTDRLCLYIDAEEHELDNDVWVLVELPPNAITVSSKWLFKKKTDMDDIRAIRILIAIAAYYDYEIWQMDAKTAFLNEHISEEVYMEQPEGFVDPKYPNHVCKLKRSIYGLKQASRQWNKRFDDEIKKFGFTQNRDEPCVYLKASGSYIAILILYVDDILLMGNNIPMLQDVKSYLGKCFAMKDLGDAAYILGIKIYQDRSKWLIGLCQSAYTEKILKRYSMENSKRETIPMQEKLRLSKSQGASTPAEIQRMQKISYASAVGSIMYAVRCTHPDNTKDMFLVYGGNMERELRVSCYTDVGYLTDADTLRSQTGYVFVLNGDAIDWKSTKQSIFATSSTDAEYIAAFNSFLGLVLFPQLKNR
ncbi:retrotransposon protein, putative, ty1-copia subclass [Tanacetum coccineum]